MTTMNDDPRADMPKPVPDTQDLEPDPFVTEHHEPEPEPLLVEHHTQDEARAADSEHHTVSDPPRQTGTPLVMQGTRGETEEGAATHVERINPEPRMVMVDGDKHPGEDAPRQHRVLSYAAKEHPEGERWPYTLTRPAFVDNRWAPGGTTVWLLPREVSAFHRLASNRELLKGP